MRNSILTVLFFTSFSIFSVSLYGMKDAPKGTGSAAAPGTSGEHKAPAKGPAAPPEAEAIAEVARDLADLKIVEPTTEDFLRYLFFNAPYDSHGMRGVFVDKNNIISETSRFNRFYCPRTIDEAGLSNFLKNIMLNGRIWVHKSQRELTAMMDKVIVEIRSEEDFCIHYGHNIKFIHEQFFGRYRQFKDKETAMRLDVASLKWTDDRCFDLGDDPEEYCTISAKCLEEDSTTIDKFSDNIEVQGLQHHGYYFRSDDGNEVSCMVTEYPETQTIALHFLPIAFGESNLVKLEAAGGDLRIRRLRFDIMTLNFIGSVIDRVKKECLSKKQELKSVVVLAKESQLNIFKDLGFKAINGENAYTVYFCF